MSKTYSVKPNGVVPKSDAAKVGKALDRIAGKHGCLKPKTVVDESRPETAPLHNYFEWNDKKAGELYRQNQASQMIRCILYIEDSIPEAEQPVIRVWHNVQSDEEETGFHGRGYVHHDVIVNRPSYARQVVENAKLELEEWRKRYEDYRYYFSEIFKSIEELKVPKSIPRKKVKKKR